MHDAWGTSGSFFPSPSRNQGINPVNDVDRLSFRELIGNWKLNGISILFWVKDTFTSQQVLAHNLYTLDFSSQSKWIDHILNTTM
jgi:hypothetical protein